VVTDFGWEYVWHCHILSHEEMDMMRPVTVHVARALPAAPVLSFTRGSVDLAWTDGTPVDYLNPASWTNPGTAEVGFRIERAEVTNGVAGAYTQIAIGPANTTTYKDNPPDLTATYNYRVTAWNAAGDSPSNVITVEGLPKAPTLLTAVVQRASSLPAGAQVAVNWVNIATNATSVVLERAVGAGAYSVLATLTPTDTSYVDTAVVPGPYSYQVRAIGNVGPSAYAGPVTVTVPKPGSTTVVLNAPSPSYVGQAVTFTATVSPALATGVPGGTVTFTANRVVTAVPLNASGVATLTTADLPAGSNVITADYSGDAVFTASTGSATQTVNKTATTTVVSSSTNPSFVGQAVAFTATVGSALATVLPGGTITFAANGVTVTAPVTLDALGTATLTTADLPAGSNVITADYSGDATFLASTGSATQTVNKTATTTVLISSLNPSNVGSTVTFTATVTPSTATGTVLFTVDGGSTAVTLVGGHALFSTVFTATGAHLVDAAYSGDTAFLGSSSPQLTQTVGSLLQPTTTVVTSNRILSANLGQNITFTATVRPVTGTAIPTGTVQFNVDGVNVGGVLTMTAQGRATYSTTALSAGSHNVMATYGGSAIYGLSGSATFIQLVNQAASTTVVTSNGNPSVSGQTVTFTARVAPLAATGTVQFRLDGVDVGGPVTLGATGRATLVTNLLTVGSHTVSAAYSGNVNYLPSTSATFIQLVNQAASTTVVTSSANPSVSGQTVTFTARVSPLAATGTVQFRLDGVPAVGPVALDATGRATLVTNLLTVGSHTVSAAYSGNVNYLPSTSATLTQTVNKANSRTVVLSSSATATRGTTVVFTATVTARAPGAGTPTGTVQFRIDGVNGAALPLNVIGQAAYATSTLAVGRHTVSAVYAGDGNFNVSTSGNITQRIR
jgi:Bacterial Ig-like domain (group 3)